MKWEGFYHPDISLPVIRRRVGDEMLELLCGLGGAMLTRGWSLIAADEGKPYAYRSAVYRLRKAGLIVSHGTESSEPVFELTQEGADRLSDDLRPCTFWDVKWSGRWFLLVYDVPESIRSKRDALRKFLKRLRLGCFQKSVWVTTRDIRPMYADLCRAGNIDFVAHLFEARDVLGCPAAEVVENSWDFERLEVVQNHYCTVYETNLRTLKTKRMDCRAIIELAREEIAAYRAAMSEDPLLPRSLWPSGYSGERVWQLHRQLQSEMRKKFTRTLLCPSN
jgi:phenylacetic acid degradation operon negative regulatory protein